MLSWCTGHSSFAGGNLGQPRTTKNNNNKKLSITTFVKTAEKRVSKDMHQLGFRSKNMSSKEKLMSEESIVSSEKLKVFFYYYFHDT